MLTIVIVVVAVIVAVIVAVVVIVVVVVIIIIIALYDSFTVYHVGINVGLLSFNTCLDLLSSCKLR